MTVGTVGKLIGRIDLVWVDRVAAVLLTAGAIPDAYSQPHRSIGPVAIIALVAVTGSVAWRRADPVLSTVVGIAGLIVFEFASRYNGDGSFMVASLALDFYALGRQPWTPIGLVPFVWLLGGTAAASFVPSNGTVGSMLGAWVIIGALPFGVGRTLARRRALADELAAGAAQLLDEQELDARRAAAEERNRMARELHDVIAHCVSVMVVQTGAARRVAESDPGAAREALTLVERSGREALVELRRIVGVLRRNGDEILEGSPPGLDRLGVVIARAEAAGLAVELTVVGRLAAVPADLDLVAYRLVQEALTNAIKYAGHGRARVTVSVGAGELELRITNTGGRAEPSGAAVVKGSGHGLIGMAERVKLHGGELHAGPRAQGGFEVSARIPFEPAQEAEGSETRTAASAAEPGVGLRWPWLDPVLAYVVLVVLELAVLDADHRRGPLVLNVIVVAAIALVTVWRRRAPFVFVLVVGLLGAVMNAFLVEFKSSPVIGAYLIVVPTYSVAAWAGRRQAVGGLVLFLGGAGVSQLIAERSQLGTFAGAAFTICGSWAAGRAIRSYRLLTANLAQTNARLALEREERALLAVAGERSRIARELHAAVAGLVSAMVVQAVGALRLLGADPDRADRAMASVEDTGRAALAEMRRMLGVLRHTGGDSEPLAPQPGVDQLYGLIQQARDQGQGIELTVHGDPGTLAAGIELGLYRLLETALAITAGPELRVSLRFEPDDIELELRPVGDTPSAWPLQVMRERVSLCDGVVVSARDGSEFVARLPRGLERVLA
jgi:signal transduction histidine kinase